MSSLFASQFSEIENLASLGRLDDATKLLAPLLASDPNSTLALSLAARLELSRGNSALALKHADRLCALEPDGAESWFVLGRVQRTIDRNVAAIASYEAAIRLDPTKTHYHCSLGVALADDGRLEDAIAAYRRALDIDPSHFAAQNNLANARARLARQQGAGHSTSESETGQGRIDWLVSQARALYASGNHEDCLTAADLGLRAAPYSVELLQFAARAATRAGQTETSIARFERLAALAPRHPSLVPGLLIGFYESTIGGRSEASQKYAACLLRHDSDRARSEFLERARSLALPAINTSRDSIHALRRGYETALDELLQAGIRLPVDLRLAVVPSFFLPYHGENDRGLMVKAARFWESATPALKYRAPHCEKANRRPGRIRIGFVSRFFYEHSIAKTTEGFLRNLDKDVFESYLIHIDASTQDQRTRVMKEAADHYVAVPGDVVEATHVARIGSLELDVLFFQDIGMEAISYFLAFARLAPVQCVSFGHPDTTGIPTMDFFVSNDLYEVAQEHYSESLYLAKDLPTLSYYYRPPQVNLQRSRAHFGLPDAGALYLCPQTLFKLHPDFDAILKGILERDSSGYVVLIRGDILWFSSLLDRLTASLGDLSRRVIAVSPLPRPAFLELLALGDVMLDTLHFNGMNSSLEALSVGLPVVTLPTALQRGRHTQAMYRKMGLEACVAKDPADYVDIAVRLGKDADFNAWMRREILSRKDVLFENRSVIDEFERFFLWALDEKGVAL